MTMEEETSGITRTLVIDDKRSDIVADLFGVHFPLRLEPYLYTMTDRMVAAYQGGYWAFYLLTFPDGEHGFYMVPEIEEPVAVSCTNGWEGKLSADALGITACLCAYSHLSFTDDPSFGRLMAEHYHRLRAYMLDHEEAVAILGATD
jgi:hypothetical protein